MFKICLFVASRATDFIYVKYDISPCSYRSLKTAESVFYPHTVKRSIFDSVIRKLRREQERIGMDESDLKQRKQETGWKLKNSVNAIVKVGYMSGDILSSGQNANLKKIISELDDVAEQLLVEARN